MGYILFRDSFQSAMQCLPKQKQKQSFVAKKKSERAKLMVSLALKRSHKPQLFYGKKKARDDFYKNVLYFSSGYAKSLLERDMDSDFEDHSESNCYDGVLNHPM